MLGFLGLPAVAVHPAAMADGPVYTASGLFVADIAVDGTFTSLKASGAYFSPELTARSISGASPDVGLLITGWFADIAIPYHRDNNGTLAGATVNGAHTIAASIVFKHQPTQVTRARFAALNTFHSAAVTQPIAAAGVTAAPILGASAIVQRVAYTFPQYGAYLIDMKNDTVGVGTMADVSSMLTSGTVGVRIGWTGFGLARSVLDEATSNLRRELARPPSPSEVANFIKSRGQWGALLRS